MTGIVLTQAALHATLKHIRQTAESWDDSRDARRWYDAGVTTLLTLLDSAHAAPEHGPRQDTEHAAGGGAAWATKLEAARPAEPCYDEAGTPAPPTIELPAGPGEGDPVPATPAAHGAALPDIPAAPEAPPPAQAAEGRPSRKRATPADDALLCELWPLPIAMREVMARFNARASRPIRSDVRLYERARRLDLPIPRHQAMVAAGHAVGRRGMVKGVWTAEREAVLRARYPDEGIRAELLAALNALPGPPIVSANAVKAHAYRLGLTLSAEGAQAKGSELAANARLALARRRAERRAEIAEAAPPSVEMQAPPAEPTPAEQAAIADAALLSKQDRAKQKLRVLLAERPRDLSGAIAGIATGMGLPLREAMRLMGEVRNEGLGT